MTEDFRGLLRGTDVIITLWAAAVELVLEGQNSAGRSS
jgi:hypothetical protein